MAGVIGTFLSSRMPDLVRFTPVVTRLKVLMRGVQRQIARLTRIVPLPAPGPARAYRPARVAPLPDGKVRRFSEDLD